MIDELQKIEIKNPVDLIIDQVRALIASGKIKPNDKLPSERKLADHLGVSRSHVREALSKLQFYGIVKRLPQSGTQVTGLGTVALQGLISEVLRIEKTDLESLIETRLLLEGETAKLASLHRTEKDIEEMHKALDKYISSVSSENFAMEEDLLFHIKIAEAGKNKVLKSLLMIITPDVVKRFDDLKICEGKSIQTSISEHQDILNKIIAKDVEGAQEAMMAHLIELKQLLKHKNK